MFIWDRSKGEYLIQGLLTAAVDDPSTMLTASAVVPADDVLVLV